MIRIQEEEFWALEFRLNAATFGGSKHLLFPHYDCG